MANASWEQSRFHLLHPRMKATRHSQKTCYSYFAGLAGEMAGLPSQRSARHLVDPRIGHYRPAAGGLVTGRVLVTAALYVNGGGPGLPTAGLEDGMLLTTSPTGSVPIDPECDCA